MEKRIVKNPSIVSKTWGKEIHIINNINNNYCGKILVLERDKYCSLHCHIYKHEYFYIDKGKVKLQLVEGYIYEDFDTKEKNIGLLDTNKIEEIILEEGNGFVVDRGLYHRFIGLENSEIIEISTFDRSDDNFRINPSYPDGELDLKKLDLIIKN